VSAAHAVEDVRRDGFPALRLVSPAGLAATWVPAAGMVCASLEHRGAELLGQRRGLGAYAARGSTMGIPLLHPWANRLRRLGYATEGREVLLPRDSPRIHLEEHGLPIHGLLAGFPGWEVVARAADAGAARLAMRLDFGAHPELLALFPFPHEVRVEARLAGPALAVETTVRATGDVEVPIAFGWHPYFRLPDVPRRGWEVTLPVRRRMRLAGGLPTGETEPVDLAPGPLGDRVFDDLFVELAPDPVFRLAAGGRTIAVAFGEGYRMAQVFAPAADDVVCFEPMTAPADPFEGGTPLVRVAPGASFRAGFTVSVS
jgi:aldose 1-epimerase